MIFRLEFFVVDPPSLSMSHKENLIAHVGPYVWVQDPRSNKSSIVSTITHNDWLVEGQPELHAITEQRVRNPRVVGEPVNY